MPSNLSEWEKIPEGESMSIAYMVDQVSALQNFFFFVAENITK
jgi:hypothetical protein